jgi:peptidoglycan/LPS O-acetylase OafA/YrhL
MKVAMERSHTRWELLAGLRFILAAIVICGHVTFYFANVDPVTVWLGNLGGKAAVVGFLLVSGYSIAASIAKRPDGFYRRRLWRIYPLYILAILFASGVEIASGGVAHMPSGASVTGNGAVVALGNALLLQTFLVKPMAFDGPVWSLAVEVSYYVAAPLLLRLDRHVLLGVLALSALAYIAPRHDDWGPVYFAFSRLNALIFAWAWLMGFLLHGARQRGLPVLFAVAGAGFIALNPFNNPEALAPVTFLAALGCVVAAGTVSPAWQVPRWGRRVLLYLGDLSYPLYLIHFPALIVAVRLGITSPGIAMLFATALSAAALYVVDVRLKQGVAAAIARWRSHAQPPIVEGTL